MSGKHLCSLLSDIRYIIIRTVSCPVPFLTNDVPLIGGRSFAELLIMVAMAALFFVTAGSGSTESIICAMLVLFGLRNNVLAAIFGVSFERALYFHKWSGILAISVVIIHAVAKGEMPRV